MNKNIVCMVRDMSAGRRWRFYFGLYSSPMAIATAAAGFFVFKRIPVMQLGGGNSHGGAIYVFSDLIA